MRAACSAAPRATVVLPSARAVAIDHALGRDGILTALAATAYHAIAGGAPELIVGHGILGRLIARLVDRLRRARADGVGDQSGAPRWRAATL